VSSGARAALSKILPPGYRTAAVLPCPIEGAGKDHFVAALVDRDADHPVRAVRLLYLAWQAGWTLLDTVEMSGDDAALTPQYLHGIDVVLVGAARLLYVYTGWFGGGSGSEHYFHFFAAGANQLLLVGRFQHPRMERGLLCLRNERIYDATIVCERGEKRARSHVYRCCLDATEFTYSGTRVVPSRTERLEERTGDRYLSDAYRNICLRCLLKRGGHFL
jgi:hypothetical protein